MSIQKPPIGKTKTKPGIPAIPRGSLVMGAPPVPKQTKAFSVSPWVSNDGEKIIVYGDTGIGKSSLCLLAPTPVFIGLDDGSKKLRHPVTGEPPMRIDGVESFADTRSALQQLSLFDKFETIVVDTVTVLQDLAEPYMFSTIPGPKGAPVKNIEGYGYNKGYKHLYDVMKLILQDCDSVVKAGKNIIFIAQSLPHRISNPGGEDFLRDGPRLHVDKTWSIEALYSEWADHILRVDYYSSFVKDKKIAGDTTRAIFAQPEVYFRAKSRTLSQPVLSYETSSDDSVWNAIFGGE